MLERFDPQCLGTLANALALLHALHVLMKLSSQMIELLERRYLVAPERSFFGKRDNTLRDDGEFSLAALHVVPAVFDLRFQVGQPFTLRRHCRQVCRADVFWQTDRLET